MTLKPIQYYNTEKINTHYTLVGAKEKEMARGKNKTKKN